MSHDHHHHDHDHHEHGHDHGHGPSPHPHSHAGHGHHHAPTDFGRAFAVGIALNAAYVICEATYGVFANSLALLADAGHNAGDVVSLGLAWLAAWLSGKAPSTRYTYGLRSSSILAALANAVLLAVITGATVAPGYFASYYETAGYVVPLTYSDFDIATRAIIIDFDIQNAFVSASGHARIIGPSSAATRCSPTKNELSPYIRA